ncbi:type II toxin-antitoxin system CcdA family antitoxin [Pelotalea chapellei]|uniref:Type II toxin-antitoxin system CcdA family antitoxin n=1 Tax=Pelotalea chapellei TaxID=44671 RepID=A0ABS5U407_9BACT|nr:type II toxin-antitoxin system CcdA family antitoxin [Pelotalea chapellei]MBT1070406.1 type II toxin-antitoxin system CcdA family antitoxin [Pelotalea chapellei]
MEPACKEKIKRKPTNLSVRVDLLGMAREDNLNLSGMLEKCLVDYAKTKREKDWLGRNRKAINDMNAFIDEIGLFSDGRKLF